MNGSDPNDVNGLPAPSPMTTNGNRLDLIAALVLLGVADEQVVRHGAEHRVPLADARLEVLENPVVRVGEGQEVACVLVCRLVPSDDDPICGTSLLESSWL